MFINYISLMLINLVAGLFLLASYVYYGLDNSDRKRWVPGFGITGAIALLTGLHMTFTWPIRGSFNIAYGETTILFGILFIATSIALAQGWDLMTIAVYGFFAGLAALVIGVRIINLDITKRPLLTGIGFILTGLGGIFASPTLYFRTNRTLRLVGTIVLVAAACIFALTGYLTYWGHIADYSNWQPLPMRTP
ncbi:DUF981 family protein [Scytonema sp. NUACC26]|uniref:DUF981 family protein n=1 Tax=Scytonema sp. NUACC26 TaxID=3140176 RepID=UPI0034DC4EFA